VSRKHAALQNSRPTTHKGSGDPGRDASGFVRIGVQFGSRGLGPTSATRDLKAARGKDGMNVHPR
jgi:hypothetical protein